MQDFKNVAHIDRSKLQGVLDLAAGDVEFVKDLTDIFNQRVPELTAALEKSLQAGDAALTEKLAHALKGTCGNLGAERLRQICEHLEICGRDGQLTKLSEYVADLKESYQIVAKHLGEAV